MPVILVVGNGLSETDRVTAGLYAVCKADTGWPLRVTLFRELAERWRHPTRDVRECWLKLERE